MFPGVQEFLDISEKEILKVGASLQFEHPNPRCLEPWTQSVLHLHHLLIKPELLFRLLKVFMEPGSLFYFVLPPSDLSGF
jgi:hypothetical protein